MWNLMMQNVVEKVKKQATTKFSPSFFYWAWSAKLRFQHLHSNFNLRSGDFFFSPAKKKSPDRRLTVS